MRKVSVTTTSAPANAASGSPIACVKLTATFVPHSGWMSGLPASPASTMSATGGSGSHSTSIRSTASSARARLSAGAYPEQPDGAAVRGLAPADASTTQPLDRRAEIFRAHQVLNSSPARDYIPRVGLGIRRCASSWSTGSGRDQCGELLEDFEDRSLG